MKLILVGAGGHARNIVEMLASAGHELIGYVDPMPCSWIGLTHWRHDSETRSLPREVGIVLGIGGVTPDQLGKRMQLLQQYRDVGRAAPAVVHPQAIVSKYATVGEGTHVMAGAVVQANARIGAGAIVNTGAIVEHDARVDDGVHVAPGAIVLGAVSVGACSMVGAGSVIIQSSKVPAATLIKAGTRFPE